MGKPRIVVVGSANTDMVVQVETIPHLGETVLGGSFVTAQGGKGANQAVAAARLGAEVTFIARLGRDDFGQKALSTYQAEGINTEFITLDEVSPSGVALIMVSKKGENIIAVAPGANSRLSASNVQAAESAFQAADTLLLQLEIPLQAVQAAIELARKNHVRVILNPAPARPLPEQMLRSVDFLTPNESELSILAKEPSELKGLKALILTLGARGAMVKTEGSETLVPGYRVTPIDTVAAGDAFNAALAVALTNGRNLLDAIRFANAAGALTVTRVGAQPSLPTIEELHLFLNQMKE